MRRFALAAVVTLGGFGVAAACGEPYEGESDPPSEAGADATTDAPVGDDAASDAGPVEPDAPPPIDATSDKPAVDANCNPCDCDGDGFSHGDAATCPDAGGKAGGDCDDLDLRAHPDAGFSADQPSTDTKGDWNCDGNTNRQYVVNVKCSDYPGEACPPLSGFTGDPGCGEEGTFVTCKAVGLTFFKCVEADTEKRIQGCR